MFTEKFSRPQLTKSFQEKFGARVKFNEPLAPYVAYQVGGPADILVFPKDEADLDWIASVAKAHDIPITTIGTGTNLLVLDEGIRGITISIKETFKEIEILKESSTTVSIRCGGGVEKMLLLDWAVERAFAGLEFSSGVPGTIGGGIFMNAGTKYGCYGDILTRMRLYDFQNGGREYSREEIDFGYRKQSLVTLNTLVSWVDLELRRGDTQELRTEVDRIIEERAAKQPLDFPSCGSTFKNPEGYSAGRLIEKSGLKGLKVGNAEISKKHANFILNKGNAKASDILELIQIIKKEVYSRFGVNLDCEVIVLGGPVAQNQI